jgi:hypothetical protein
MGTFKRTLLYVMSTVVILLACGITLTIGWRPIIGPRARGLTTRTFERTPTRLARLKFFFYDLAYCLLFNV